MPFEDTAQTSENIARLKRQSKAEPVASLLKMELQELKPGYSKIALKVRPEHLNFNKFIFGGIIMSLADEAFGYAVNTLNSPTVATQFNINFLAAAKEGDELTAEGNVIKAGKRVITCEMTVTGNEGKLIARATGTSIPLTERPEKD